MHTFHYSCTERIGISHAAETKEKRNQPTNKHKNTENSATAQSNYTRIYAQTCLSVDAFKLIGTWPSLKW